jgi:hypothetical protein
MKRTYAVKIGVGVILAAAGIILPFLVDGMESLSSVLVAIGLVTVAVTGVQHWRYSDDLEKDERTQKLGAYAISYSWLLTIVFLAILFWVDYVGLLVLSVQAVLVSAILLMGLSARLFQWYLFRQGDVA